jgi:thiosulfate reductase cytochrome b subunit
MPRIYVHPLPVRIWHWINALGFLAMIFTGLQIRYIGLIDLVAFRTAVNLHNWIGFVLIGNFFVWLLFYLFSDKIRVYHPELSPVKHFRASFRQAMFYGYGIFKGEPNPHHVSVYQKFNSMQSMSYQVIMLLLVPIQFYTGLLLWDVKLFPAMIDALGGVRVVDTAHVLITIFFAGFLPVHIYLATLGHTRMAHITSMFTGYEEVPEGHGSANPRH